MRYEQWQRAQFIIEQMKQLDDARIDIVKSRAKIKQSTKSRFTHCHDCLLLAVYGFYKNGFIKDTNRTKSQPIDFVGFDGHYSIDIQHAFDALAELQKGGRTKLTATALKAKLDGEASIYSFVVYYFNNDLLRLE